MLYHLIYKNNYYINPKQEFNTNYKLLLLHLQNHAIVYNLNSKLFITISFELIYYIVLLLFKGTFIIFTYYKRAISGSFNNYLINVNFLLFAIKSKSVSNPTKVSTFNNPLALLHNNRLQMHNQKSIPLYTHFLMLTYDTHYLLE